MVAQWHQPAALQDNRFDPDTLPVIEGSQNLNILGWPHRHDIRIGRDDDTPSYGLLSRRLFHAGYEHVDDHIAKAQVERSAEGVTLTEPTRQSLYLSNSLPAEEMIPRRPVVLRRTTMDRDKVAAPSPLR